VGVNNADVQRAYAAAQGRYLGFIYYYNKLHGVRSAETDMQRYFKVSALRSTAWSSPWRSGSSSSAHPAQAELSSFC